ncbi:MAG: hypothetical protein C4345_15050 [Chloroflexota bacterium]
MTREESHGDRALRRIGRPAGSRRNPAASSGARDHPDRDVNWWPVRRAISRCRPAARRRERPAGSACEAGCPWPAFLGRDHTELTRKTIRLAGLLEVDRIIAQSGAPGDTEGSRVPNWVAYPWPEDMLDTVRRQWDQVVTLWTDLAAYAREHGVRRICFELHPVNLVYNVPTLLRLREAVGETIGANFDPSHLMWQGMDIPACVRALGKAIFHVHIKDVAMHLHNQD